MQNTTNIGEYIKETIFESMNLNQQELASKLKVSRQTIHNLLTGNTKLSYSMALRLAAITKDDVDYILEGAENGFDKISQPLIVKWAKRSSPILVYQDILEGHRAGLLGIKHFVENNIQPASYDLRIKEAIIYCPGEGDQTLDENNQRVSFKPGAIAIVESYEEFEFPMYLLGRLGIMMNFAENGLFVSHGLHIDPGYTGPIHTTIKNFGRNKSFYLEYEMPFLSLELSYISTSPAKSHSGRASGFSDNERATVKNNDPLNHEKGKEKELLTHLKKLIENYNSD